MAKKSGGDDGYGYDPERAAVRDMFEGVERRQAQRPDKPARQIGEVLKLPKITTTQKRLLTANAAILNGPAKEIAYQHSVLCQTGLPYKPVKDRRWIQQQGAAMLAIEAGIALDPKQGKVIELDLPHGERPRLILMYLNAEALRTESPVIEVEGSMTAFARRLGMDTNGPSLRMLKDQLGRLAAATVRIGYIEDSRTVQINTQIVGAFDLWFPKDENQRVLWPSMVRLSADYFASLQNHAVPLDERAIAALAGSALGLDLYAWLAQRLHRIAKGRPQRITWTAIKGQFGCQYDRMDHFRQEFKRMLRQVLTVYPGANVGKWIEDGRSAGLILGHSKPPVFKRLIQIPRAGLVIDQEPG